MLTNAELKTFLHLIDRAADEMSNHGCNDLLLLADCKLNRSEAQEIRELVHAYCEVREADQPVRDDSKKEVYTIDWLTLRALTVKLKKLHGGAS